MIEKGYEYVRSKVIQCQRLEDLLDTHLKAGQNIDFLNLDIEGKDEEICLDFNWNKYRPKVVCVEVFSDNIEDLGLSQIHRTLTKNNYVLKSYLDMSAVYLHKG